MPMPAGTQRHLQHPRSNTGGTSSMEFGLDRAAVFARDYQINALRKACTRSTNCSGV